MKTICVFALLFAVAGNAAPLATNAPLPVRILYDNSGSMYPGYRPPGSPDRRTREQLGVHFFHQSPRFASWLNDFVQRQESLNAGTIGMWTFTSDGEFTPEDIREVHPVVRPSAFSAETAIANFPDHAGNNTYLTETLTSFTRDFTGLLWLVTDNIVETTVGEPDTGVQRFFKTLAQSNDLRSVHLFKHTFEENGHRSALAVYGILVSAADVPDATLAHYDAKLRGLFPGREHLKLKNLAITPVILHELQLLLDNQENGTFKEGQSVQLALAGEIRSHLTQHAVIAGRYELSIASAFVPESWAQQDLGAQSLAPQIFDSISEEITGEIPPNGKRPIQARLHSTQPVSFSPRGVAEWLRLAWNGAAVRYTGNVRMSLADVKVRLQRQEMAGIFGIDQASSIFEFQDVTTLSGIEPIVVPVSFALRTGASRTAVLLAILGIVAATLAAAALLLSAKQTFRISLTSSPETIIALRRLGTHNLIYEGKLLGRLSRSLINGYDFQAVRGTPEFTILPGVDGETWDVKFTSGASRRLTIKADGAGRHKQQKTGASPTRAAPPRPPSPLSRGVPPPPPGRPSRTGR